MLKKSVSHDELGAYIFKKIFPSTFLLPGLSVYVRRLNFLFFLPIHYKKLHFWQGSNEGVSK